MIRDAHHRRVPCLTGGFLVAIVAMVFFGPHPAAAQTAAKIDFGEPGPQWLRESESYAIGYDPAGWDALAQSKVKFITHCPINRFIAIKPPIPATRFYDFFGGGVERWAAYGAGGYAVDTAQKHGGSQGLRCHNADPGPRSTRWARISARSRSCSTSRAITWWKSWTRSRPT